MPSNYTGDPTTAAAPDAAPGPENYPVSQLPVDGDALNAASIQQAIKAPSNHIAWLKSPRATGSSWSQPVRSYRNSRLHSRAIVDHLGFPAGKLIAWQEDWSDIGFTTKNTLANGSWAKRWMYSLAGPVAGTINAGGQGGPGTPPVPRSHCLSLATASSGITAYSSHVETRDPIWFDEDTDLAMQWDFNVGGGTANAEFAMGLATTSQLGVATGFFAGLLDGAALIRRPGVTNWEAYSKPFSVTHTKPDTGVALAGASRARIELRGANVSDDTTARALFYLDGALTNNVVVDIGNGGASLMPFFRVTQTGVISTLYIGTLDFCANLAIGDVQL